MEKTFQIEGAEEAGTRVRHRLGVVGLPGFAPVPHMLMLYQSELGLSSEELNVFLNIYMHWHDAGRLPYPHASTIAKRMGVSKRTVQRLINRLTKKGMLQKKPGHKRTDIVKYDVRPLLLMLQPRAKEWAAQRQIVLEEGSRPIIVEVAI